MGDLAHQFLKWFPTATCGGVVAVGAVWPKARDWIGSQTGTAWSAMSDPVIAGLLLFSFAAYVAAIIWTGQKAPEAIEPDVVWHRQEPDAIGDLFRRSADRHAAKRNAQAKIEGEVAGKAAAMRGRIEARGQDPSNLSDALLAEMWDDEQRGVRRDV